MAHLAVAGVHVDAVHGEGLQARDLQLALAHLLLHEVELLQRRDQGGRAAAVQPAGAQGRGHRAVGVQPLAPAGHRGVGGAGHHVSAPGGGGGGGWGGGGGGGGGSVWTGASG